MYEASTETDVDRPESESDLPPTSGWRINAGSEPPPTLQVTGQDGGIRAGGAKDALSGSANDGSFGETEVSILLGSIGVGAVLALLLAFFCYVRSFAVFTLLLSILSLIAGIVNAITIIGIPPAAITIVASIFSIPGASIIACACKCCAWPDGRPGGHLSCAILSTLSVILRLVSLIVHIPILVIGLISAAAAASPVFMFVYVANLTCIILTVITGVAESILGIKCLFYLACCTKCVTRKQEQPSYAVEVPGSDPLPEGYSVHLDGARRPYFYNQETRTSTYIDPRQPPPQPPPYPNPHGSPSLARDESSFLNEAFNALQNLPPMEQNTEDSDARSDTMVEMSKV